MRVIEECPVCSKREFELVFKCKDHSVSHETFSITKCKNCELYITNPQPEQDQLSKYYQSDNYISHKKNSKSIIDLLYKGARLITLRWKLFLLNKYAPGKNSLLDFGCGTGDFLKHCHEHGYTIAGVEPSEIAVAIATENTGQKIFRSLPEINSRVSIITAWHVIEHIPDLNETIKSLTATLEKNGTIFIAVPNRESYDALTYREFWAGYDVPRHLWHFSKANMIELLDHSGLQVIKILPMKLDAFYVSMLSEKYIREKFSPGGLVRSLTNALKSNIKASGKLNHSSLIYIARKK
jgi:2-polyprenyl-3-methyl-5-hydroxy-6-metoxy-1,4-benzoquinol methylase